jgi:hypothetical protein
MVEANNRKKQTKPNPASPPGEGVGKVSEGHRARPETGQDVPGVLLQGIDAV